MCKNLKENACNGILEDRKLNKKMIMIVWILIMLLTGCNSQTSSMIHSNESDLIAVAAQNGKFGFIDINGEFFIKPEFDVAMQFSNGKALVGIGEPGKTKYGYIDINGKMIVNPIYDSAFPYSEGYATVGVKPGIMKMIDLNGETVTSDYVGEMTPIIKGVYFKGQQIFNNQHELLGDFSGKVDFEAYTDEMGSMLNFSFPIIIKEDYYEYRFINEYGESAVTGEKYRFSFARPFTDSSTLVDIAKEGGEPIIIDKKGKSIALNKRLYYYDSFYEGLCLILDEEGWSYIDKTGMKAITLDHLSPKSMILNDDNMKPRRFSEGLAAIAVAPNFEYGYIDLNGEMIITPQFMEASDFVNGYATVSINGRYGVIDKKGEYIINPSFDYIGAFSYRSEVLEVKEGPYLKPKQPSSVNKAITGETEADMPPDNTSVSTEVASDIYRDDAFVLLDYTLEQIEETFGTNYDVFDFEGAYFLDYNSEDIPYTFGFDNLDNATQVHAVYLFENVRVKGITIGMSPNEIISVLGEPTYMGISEEDGTFFTMYEFDKYRFDFTSENENQPTTYGVIKNQ